MNATRTRRGSQTSAMGPQTTLSDDFYANVPAFEAPTAVQAEAEEQEAPNKIPPPADGLGVAWMDHRVPSHRSARVIPVPERVNALPTATQVEADVQSTAYSALLNAPWGLGVDSTLQLVRSTAPPGSPWFRAVWCSHRQRCTRKSWSRRPRRAGQCAPAD